MNLRDLTATAHHAGLTVRLPDPDDEHSECESCGQYRRVGDYADASDLIALCGDCVTDMLRHVTEQVERGEREPDELPDYIERERP